MLLFVFNPQPFGAFKYIIMRTLKNDITKVLVQHLIIKKVKKNGTIVFKLKNGTEDFTDDLVEMIKKNKWNR